MQHIHFILNIKKTAKEAIDLAFVDDIERNLGTE